MKCKESSILKTEKFDKNWNLREIFKIFFRCFSSKSWRYCRIRQKYVKITDNYEKLFFLNQFLIGFIAKSMKILDRAFCIFPKLWVGSTPQHCWWRPVLAVVLPRWPYPAGPSTRFHVFGRVCQVRRTAGKHPWTSAVPSLYSRYSFDRFRLWPKCSLLRRWWSTLHLVEGWCSGVLNRAGDGLYQPTGSVDVIKPPQAQLRQDSTHLVGQPSTAPQSQSGLDPAGCYHGSLSKLGRGSRSRPGQQPIDEGSC